MLFIYESLHCYLRGNRFGHFTKAPSDLTARPYAHSWYGQRLIKLIYSKYPTFDHWHCSLVEEGYENLWYSSLQKAVNKHCIGHHFNRLIVIDQLVVWKETKNHIPLEMLLILKCRCNCPTAAISTGYRMRCEDNYPHWPFYCIPTDTGR